MDPITFAIRAAISAGVLDGTKKPISDLYAKLKALLKQKYGADSALNQAIESLEKELQSIWLKTILMEEVALAKADKDLEILEAVQDLIMAIKAQEDTAKGFDKGGISIGGNTRDTIVTGNQNKIDNNRSWENNTAEGPKELRVDVAVPRKVLLKHSFVMAVAIKQKSSPQLKDVDLPKLKSGDLKVDWPKDIPYIQLWIRISAPECKILGNAAVSFKLAPDQDSPVFHFILMPQKSGPVHIVVDVYQAIDYLGSAYIKTSVSEQLAGSVQVNVESVIINIINQSTTVGNISNSNDIAIGSQASVMRTRGASDEKTQRGT